MQPTQTPFEPVLPTETPVQPVVQPPLTPNSAPPAPKSKKKLFIIIGIVLVILIAIGVIISLSSSSKSETKQTTTQKTSTPSVSNFRYMDYESAYDGFRQRGINEFRTDKKQTTITALKELTEGFVFTSQEKESDTAKQLAALGMAYIYAEKKVDKDVSRNKLYMLFQEDLEKLPNGITDENANMPNPTQAKTIYEKYQDKNLSDQLRKVIASNGLEAKAKEMLKINNDQLKDYQIYAMNFDSKSDQEKKFVAEMKFTGWMPSIWTQTYTDARYIGFTKQYAKEFVNSLDETSRAYFLHEFSHTQSPLNRGGLGVLPEERKAEEVSGNKGAYYDVKQFFIYMNVFTGYDILPLISNNPTNAEAVYVDIYKNLGVELGDSIIASFPVAYLENANTPLKTINQRHNLNSSIQIAIALGKAKDQNGQKKRLQERADRLISVFGSKEEALFDVSSNLATANKMPSAAEQIKPYLQ